MISSNPKTEVGSRISQFIRLFKTAIESGVSRDFLLFHAPNVYITKVEAYRRYGRSTVDRWIKEKLIKPCSSGMRKNVLKVLELEGIASKSNRVSYLEVSNR